MLASDTLILGANGYTLQFSAIDNGSTDNCSLDSAQLNGASSIVFGCTDTGWSTINVVLFDQSGNTATGAVDVYVLDTLVPTYSKNPFTAYLIGDSVHVRRSDFLTNVTGGCGSTLHVAVTSDTVFTCADALLNPHYVGFTISTANFSITDSVAVTVLDTLAPQINLHTDTLYLAGSPLQAQLTFNQINNGTTDNCGIDTLNINGADTLTFNCSDLGMQRIVVYAADASGNMAQDSIDIWVLDTIAPAYTKVPQTVYLQTDSVIVHTAPLLTALNAGCFAPQVTWLGDTIFTCADASATPNYIPFTISAAGITRTDSVAITVLDTVKPVIAVAPVDTAIIFGTSLTLDFTHFDQGSFDNCGIDSVTINGTNQLTYGCSDLGLQTVAVAIWDVHGNSAYDTISLLVIDTVSPSYTKTPHTAYLTGSTVAVSRGDILTNIGGGCSSASGSVALLSDTVFNCTNLNTNPNWIHFSATAGGITVFDSVPVTVVDTVKPVFATKPTQTIYLNAAGSYTLTLADLVQGVPTDNCGIDSVAITPPVLGCTSIGTFSPIAIQMWDASGNSATEFMFVLAVDTVKPVLVVQSTNIDLDPFTGTYTLTANDVIQQVADNCSLASVVITPNTFTCADTGAVNVVITATDASGNVHNKTVPVNVSDVTPPAVQAVTSYQVYLNAFGTASLSLGDVLIAQPFDACGIVDTLFSKSSFTCNDVGFDSVFFALTDPSGNVTSGAVLLSIQDTIRPSATFKPVVLKLDTTGTATLGVNDVIQTINDNCGVNLSAVVFSKSLFTCTDIGFQTVYVTIFDIHGNSRLYQIVVEVEGSSGWGLKISGPANVCQNQFNVKYKVDSVATFNTYDWKLPIGCKEISRSFKGREIYVHWLPGYAGGTLRLIEYNGICTIDSVDFTVTATGAAPDTATISYWNEQTKTTLVISDNTSSYYQWGFDQWINGTRVSTPIAGANKSSYYNTLIASNIADFGYQYWCETSRDSVCFNRSYFMGYPVDIVEDQLDNIVVWPNPFTQYFTISATAPIKQIEIFDLFGKTVFKTHYDENENEVIIDAALPAATYFVTLTLQNGKQVNHKIIKTK